MESPDILDGFCFYFFGSFVREKPKPEPNFPQTLLQKAIQKVIGFHNIWDTHREILVHYTQVGP